MAIATASGWAPRGYFMPYRYAEAAGRKDAEGYPALERYFEEAHPAFKAMIDDMDGYRDTLLAFDGPPPEPRWRQDWFPGLDGAAMYTMIRERKPARIVEVGSGHSTRFMARAIRDSGLECQLTAIDPAPRADIAALGIEILRCPLQHVATSPFEDLSPGDIVSMDSSHLAVAGSDVDIMINTILPGLPDGVLVHIHDMFLPDAYPRHWQWREYNEQSLVAPLIHGGGYRLIWASLWIRTRLATDISGTVAADLHVPEGGIESSLWLEKQTARS